MNRVIQLSVACVLGLLVASYAGAADAPSLATPGKLLFEDDFSRDQLKPKWVVGKGFWSVKDGAVSAAENPDDKHAAYSYINPNVDYKDAVVEFGFHFDGAQSIQLNIRDSRWKDTHAGHIARVQIQPKLVQLADWKTGVMKNEYYEKNKDPKTTPEEKKAIFQKIKDKTASYKTSFDLAAWHTARIEVANDEMLLSIDCKPVGYLKSEGIDHAAKNMVGITVGGKTGQVKNFKFWQATPAPDWPSHREAVLSSMQK